MSLECRRVQASSCGYGSGMNGLLNKKCSFEEGRFRTRYYLPGKGIIEAMLVLWSSNASSKETTFQPTFWPPGIMNLSGSLNFSQRVWVIFCEWILTFFLSSIFSKQNSWDLGKSSDVTWLQAIDWNCVLWERICLSIPLPLLLKLKRVF